MTDLATVHGIRLVSDLATGLDAAAPRGRDVFTIRDLTKEFGVSARTLRFYEEKGLSIRRGAANSGSIRAATVRAWLT